MDNQLNANGWAVIIAAIGVVLVQITGMILSYLRDQKAEGKLNIIEKQTNGDMTKRIADSAASAVVKTAETVAERLVHTATAAATVAATTAATTAATAAIVAANAVVKSK